jgi:hypothetical protein
LGRSHAAERHQTVHELQWSDAYRRDRARRVACRGRDLSDVLGGSRSVSLDGWGYWEIKKPDSDRWVQIDKLRPAVSAVSSARIAMDSRSSAAHRTRSRVNAAAKASARSRVAYAYATDAACRARLRRLYHVDRETPSASQGCFAGRLGPMPCALRQRSERKRFFSRRSGSIIVGPLCLGSLDTVRPQETI